ncbi:N-acetyltransferase [Chitiniphilus shinanonensis]|uniref:N-acetyltransferase n=1 Tax=Chitiniphilus shinanonensis TaxID=553088 RepID=A0ABQ6BPZ7_9NEIS|nr:N-acetyltransferase [Chitiniphilus shinanonensis]GLS04095.1 N-acetyltransferase [Chitiniphilus shinanonensis]
MLIRVASHCDAPRIHAITAAAFGQVAEADLIEALVHAGHVRLSLVGIGESGDIVAHVLFSPVECPGADGEVLGLAPIAVDPAWQGQGRGSLLVREALRQLQHDGVAAVVVLGDPAYYSRFGFVPASRFGLSCAYDVPHEYFMALELIPGALAAGNGAVAYAPEFAAL